MPRKIYPGVGALYRRRFVKTGAFRPPKKGEAFLSGAVPEVYNAGADMTTAYHIMRDALEEEARCGCCGRALPDAR